MGHLAFFLLVVLASLLWSAACTAAAARVERPLWKALLVAAGVVLPILALLPWLGATAFLAFGAGLRPNWFAPTLTVCLAALVGGIWIVVGGLSRSRSADGAVASCWPVVGLFALAIIAKAVCFGTLLILDNAVAAEARSMRVEAATMMQAALPPAPAEGGNAAPLHLQAAAAIAAAPDLTSADGILGQTDPDIAGPDVAERIDRHAGLLDTIRRAADLPGCRFERDWTRPSLTMLLSEVQAGRTEARLLALAARREAHDGHPAEALADAVRIGRLGRQFGSEPILISHLVGVAIDAVALSVLADILPRLGPADAPLLDDPALRDLVAGTPSISRALLGEEAFGLATFAAFADGREGLKDFAHLSGEPNLAAVDAASPLLEPLSAAWRVFLLPGDIAGYRRRYARYRQLVSGSVDQSKSWPDLKAAVEGIEGDLRKSGPEGILSRLIVPAIGSVLRSQSMAEARHRAAAILVAATRERLAGGGIPDSPEVLVPGWLPVIPRDPFVTAGPMRMRVEAGGVVAWSVGPDGEDDGGPQPAGAEHDAGNDDVGLRMAVGAPAAP